MSYHGKLKPANLADHLRDAALDQLRKVGDETLGQWVEIGEVAVHVRRRLTPMEMKMAGLKEVVDVRGTPDHQARVDRMRPYLPLAVRDLPVADLQ